MQVMSGWTGWGLWRMRGEIDERLREGDSEYFVWICYRH